MLASERVLYLTLATMNSKVQATPHNPPREKRQALSILVSKMKMPRFNVTGDHEAFRKKDRTEDVYLRIQYPKSEAGVVVCHRTAQLAGSRTQWPPSPKPPP